MKLQDIFEENRIRRKSILENTNNGKAGMQKMSMMQAFGSKGRNIIHDIGIKMLEKPYDFAEIREKAELTRTQYKKLKNQLNLKTYYDNEIFGKYIDDMDATAGVLMDAKLPKEATFIVEFTRTGNQYLVDTSGARTYIRNWAFIG